MRLILIRHGETTANVALALDTAVPGADLTELGHAQAAALTDTLDGTAVDAIYASTLVRTQQTAAPLATARRLTVQVRSGLREISAGDLEMADDAESVRHYLDTSLAWAAGDLTPKLPGGETGAAVLSRFDAVVEEAAATGAESVALFSHGTIIRAWATARSDFPAERAARSRLANTDVVELEGSPDDGWRVLTWAGTPVNDPHLRTAS